MISIENNFNYNKLRRKKIGSKVTSIWDKDTLFLGSRTYPVLNFTYMTSNFSDFEKNIYNTNNKIVYHLNGYGVKFNEALASFIGESAERYTFVSFYNMIQDNIINLSYRQMCKKYGNDKVCDLDLINIYFNEENIENYITEDDNLKWIPMNSLINLGEKVYIPLQFIIMNNGYVFSNEKNFMPSSVSTGTACYENISLALENALIEFLQLDSFNLWWYGGIKGNKINLNIYEFLIKYFKNKININEFINNFNVIFTDISYDKDLDIVVCEIFSKYDILPKYTVGIQATKDMKKSIYRSFMEALSVLEYNMNVIWMDKEQYFNVNKNLRGINNLDENIIYYSKYGKNIKIEHNYEFNFKTKKCKEYNLVNNVKELSKFAGYLVITNPEFQNMNLEVVRVYIPELLPLCLPSYPPIYHKRYNYIKGIKNNVPHPLA